MNAIQEVQRLAAQKTEVEKLRAIAESAATVLTKMGFPTQIIYAPAQGGRPASPGSRGGKKGPRPKKKGKRVVVKKDGTYAVVRDDDYEEEESEYEQDGILSDESYVRDAGGGFGYDGQIR